MVDNLNTTLTATYKAQQFQDYNVAGEKAGQFKQAGNFAYIRFFGAGHEVPAYKVISIECYVTLTASVAVVLIMDVL